MPKAPGTCHLLQMPPEVRNMIYCLVLCPGEVYIGPRVRLNRVRIPIIRRGNSLKRLRNPPRSRESKTISIDCSILRVCKLVNSEATGLLYARNRFCIAWLYIETSTGSTFLDHVVHINSASLRFLGIHSFYEGTDYLPTSGNVKLLIKMYHLLPGLEELKLWQSRTEIVELYQSRRACHRMRTRRPQEDQFVRMSWYWISRFLILILQALRGWSPVAEVSPHLYLDKENTYVRLVFRGCKLAMGANVS